MYSGQHNFTAAYGFVGHTVRRVAYDCVGVRDTYVCAWQTAFFLHQGKETRRQRQLILIKKESEKVNR